MRFNILRESTNDVKGERGGKEEKKRRCVLPRAKGLANCNLRGGGGIRKESFHRHVKGIKGHSKGSASPGGES